MEAEVHLDDEIATKPATCRLYIQNKSIGTRIVIAKRTATGTIERLDNTIDPNEVDNYIQESLIGEPSQLPQTISLQHDEESEDLAKGIENKAKDFIKEKGIEKLVTIKMELYHLKNGQ